MLNLFKYSKQIFKFSISQPCQALLPKYYMKPQKIDIPLWNLNKSRKYKYFRNKNDQLYENWKQIIARKLELLKKLRMDPQKFVQYRYDSNGQLQFFGGELQPSKKKKSLRNPTQVIRVYKNLAKNEGLDYQQLQKIGLPFKMPDFSKRSTASSQEQQSKESEQQDQILAQKIVNVINNYEKQFEYVPNHTAVQHTTDLFRIDCSIVISRFPIFYSIEEQALPYLKYRHSVFRKYTHDSTKLSKRYERVSDMNESFLADHKNSLLSNLDNFPTHRIKIQEAQFQNLTIEQKAAKAAQSGESQTQYQYYCSASKNFTKVYPNIRDKRHMHYAPENRVYYLVRDKVSHQWQFPSRPIVYNQSLFHSREGLMHQISNDKWFSRFLSTQPILVTSRDFTPCQAADQLNYGLKGVRTLYFLGYHYKGAAKLSEQNDDYDDFAWVPKYELNQYLTEDYYNAVIKSMTEN